MASLTPDAEQNITGAVEDGVTDQIKRLVRNPPINVPTPNDDVVAHARQRTQEGGHPKRESHIGVGKEDLEQVHAYRRAHARDDGRVHGKEQVIKVRSSRIARLVHREPVTHGAPERDAQHTREEQKEGDVRDVSR